MSRSNSNTNQKEENKKDRSTLYAILVCFFVMGAFVLTGLLASRTEEYTYSLNEIEDGVYARSYNVHSRTPSENYSVVTLCCDGVIRTFEGDVFISYVNTEPYVRVLDNNISHGDKIYVYIQKGSAKFQDGVTVGR